MPARVTEYHDEFGSAERMLFNLGMKPSVVVTKKGSIDSVKKKVSIRKKAVEKSPLAQMAESLKQNIGQPIYSYPESQVEI